MKRVPEKFELTEEDIRKAISQWLNHWHTVDAEFDIQFSVDRVNRPPPPGAPVGGMGDYSVQVVTATASKK